MDVYRKRIAAALFTFLTLTSLRSQRLVVLGQLLQVESNEKEEQRKKRKREHELMNRWLRYKIVSEQRNTLISNNLIGTLR